MIALILLSGTFFSGLALMVVELRRAPEAYEDQTGFHAVCEHDIPSESLFFQTASEI